MEHNNGDLKMIFLCKWLIFRFHVHFQGCFIAAHDYTSSKATPPESLKVTQQAPEGSKNSIYSWGVGVGGVLAMFIIFYLPMHVHAIFFVRFCWNSLHDFNINGEIQPIPVIILMIIEIQVGFEIGR